MPGLETLEVAGGLLEGIAAEAGAGSRFLDELAAGSRSMPKLSWFAPSKVLEPAERISAAEALPASEADALNAGSAHRSWSEFMSRFKHSQGHVKNCGQISVMHGLSARPSLSGIMEQAVARDSDDAFRVRFFSPNEGEKPVWISVNKAEVTEPRGYFLKSNNARLNVLGKSGTSFIAENPIDRGQTTTYTNSEVGKLWGMKPPEGSADAVTNEQIVERAYGRFLQQVKPTRFQKLAGGGSYEIPYSRSSSDYTALNMVRSWDFAGDLTGIRETKSLLVGNADAEKLQALSTKFGNHVLTYEPEIDHVKQVVSEGTPDLHAHNFIGGHTYTVLDINPKENSITLLSSLKGQEPLTMSYSELSAADPDGVINTTRVR